MNQQPLSPQYLKAHCPIAWNTPERQDTYSKLGFDMMGEAFRLIQDALGPEGGIAPAKLPVRLKLRFSATGEEGADPKIRVAKKQDTDIEPYGDQTPCGPHDDKPVLTAEYLENHAPTTWDEEKMRFAYATLGYAIERQVIHELIERELETGEATADVAVTVDTTWTAGGCAVVCSGNHCSHKSHN